MAKITEAAITFRFFIVLPNNRAKEKAITNQISRLRINIGHELTGGQLLPIGGTGYLKIFKGNPPVAMG